MQLLSAYGGDGWQPRLQTTREELGTLWSACGLNSEWAPLRAVLLHRLSLELSASADPDAVNMLAPLDIARAQEQHDRLAEAYCAAGVRVAYVEPPSTPTPNQMFMLHADDSRLAWRLGMIQTSPSSAPVSCLIRASGW